MAEHVRAKKRKSHENGVRTLCGPRRTVPGRRAKISGEGWEWAATPEDAARRYAERIDAIEANLPRGPRGFSS